MSNKYRDQKVVTEASTSDESIMVGDVIRVRADDGGTEYALRHLANSLWTDGEPSSLTDVGGTLLFTNNGALGYMLAVALNDPRVPITAKLAGLTVEEILHTFVQNGSTRVVFFAANILHCLAPQTQAAMLQAAGVPCMAELVDAFGEAAVGAGITALAVTTWLVVTLAITMVIPAIETASYERPALVSDATIDIAERAAQVLGDDPEVRFGVDLRCGEVDAIGCAPPVHPGVIFLDAEYAEDALWYQVRSVTFHEAAHVAEQLRGLDATEFGEIDPEVKPGEALADCVANALEGVATTYVQCPIEWQERALNLLGIDRLVRVWWQSESEPTLALWR